MNFYLDESAGGYREGIAELLKEGNHSIGQEGTMIRAAETSHAGFKATVSEKEICIEAGQKAYFFRGLAKALFLLQKNQGKDTVHVIKEEAGFSSCGAMLDCSRNGVLNVENIKRYIRKMAELGMNTMMLYTEDTYKVEEYPYFGHLRGRYTKEELKECDDYADAFGIELIPCIQTLGHLHTPLRFPYFSGYKDTNDILLAEDEKVYEFIEAMIKNVTAPLRTKKIHLGMDEAHDLGLGRYLRKNGFKDRFSIMNNHLKKVRGICEKYKLEPMIWSDMYFRLLSPTGDYYDIPYDTEIAQMNRPPEGIELVYWDYYHDDKEMYRNYFRLHKKLSDKISFAGGGWTWNGLAPNYSKMLATTEAALSVCREERMPSVICTLWQDNGAETPMEAGDTALALFAEHCFKEQVDWKELKEWFAYLFKKKWDSCMMLDKFDNMEDSRPNMNADNPSKYLFYQDTMAGLFDAQIEGTEAGKYYEELADKLKIVEEENKETALFTYYRTLAKLLSLKAELGLNIRNAYQEGDRKRLGQIAGEVIPACIHEAKELLELRRQLWFSECKPLGFEILDIRFSGVTARLRSAQMRLEEYLSGKDDILLELEEDRLPFAADTVNPLHTQCSCPLWENIISAGNIIGV